MFMSYSRPPLWYHNKSDDLPQTGINAVMAMVNRIVPPQGNVLGDYGEWNSLAVISLYLVLLSGEAISRVHSSIS